MTSEEEALGKVITAIETHDRWALTLSDPSRRWKIGPNEGKIPTDRLVDATNAVAKKLGVTSSLLFAEIQAQRRTGLSVRAAVMNSLKIA